MGVVVPSMRFYAPDRQSRTERVDGLYGPKLARLYEEATWFNGPTDALRGSSHLHGAWRVAQQVPEPSGDQRRHNPRGRHG